MSQPPAGFAPMKCPRRSSSFNTGAMFKAVFRFFFFAAVGAGSSQRREYLAYLFSRVGLPAGFMRYGDKVWLLPGFSGERNPGRRITRFTPSAALGGPLIAFGNAGLYSRVILPASSPSASQ